jgi:hypothetical protein
MRLRTNELCPLHRSFFCCGREHLSNPSWSDLEFRELKIRITREDIGNYGHRGRCANY